MSRLAILGVAVKKNISASSILYINPKTFLVHIWCASSKITKSN